MAEHLTVCPVCRAWAAAVAAAFPDAGAGVLGPAEPPTGLTEQVMRAVAGDLGRVRAHRRQEWPLRGGLLAVAVVQLVLAVPVLVLVFGHDHTAPMHVAHEVGSFDAALALGMAAAARRPRLAAGMLPLVAAISVLLLLTAGSDLAAGRTDVVDETPHLLDAVGALLLRRLSVIGFSNPSGPSGMLVPMPTPPRPPRSVPGLSIVPVRFLRSRPVPAASGSPRGLPARHSP